MQKVLLIAAAGSAGALLRYFLGAGVHHIAGHDFPWGTFVVNILGCFLFGAALTMFEHGWLLSPETRVIVLTGFLGSFTTFSTYIFESGQMMREAQWLFAAGNLSLQIMIGLGAFFVGQAITRHAYAILAVGG